MHLHILGICGTFMGGIAAIANRAGFTVTGCDANVYPPMSDQLRALGIDLIDGYGADQLALTPDQFVVGNSIVRGNPLMEAILDAGAIASTIETVAAFVNGLDPEGLSMRARFDWRPALRNFPDVADDKALFVIRPDGLLLSIEARASGKDGVGTDVFDSPKRMYQSWMVRNSARLFCVPRTTY